MNYRKVYAMKAENEKRIKKLCPEADDQSGIYCFYRIDENGFRHAYIGKAERTTLLSRCADHLAGYKQHIDLSIRKYGLYDKAKNTYGYKLKVVCHCPPEQCDELERYYIKKLHDNGWQLKNVESGGTNGKTDINERKPPRTYQEGVRQGEKNMQKYVKHLFDLHLDYVPKKNPPTKLQEKAMYKFREFLEAGEENE